MKNQIYIEKDLYNYTFSEFKFINIAEFLNFYEVKSKDKDKSQKKKDKSEDKDKSQKKKLNNTGFSYKSRLIKFEKFLKYTGELINGNYKDEVYEFTPTLLKRLKTEFNSSGGDIDFYDLMIKFYDYLSLSNLFPNLNDVKSKKDHIYTVVKLLARNKVAIPNGMLKTNILENIEPEIEPDSKEGLDTDTIIKILNAASDYRFKLYLTFLVWVRLES